VSRHSRLMIDLTNKWTKAPESIRVGPVIENGEMMETKLGKVTTEGGVGVGAETSFFCPTIIGATRLFWIGQGASFILDFGDKHPSVFSWKEISGMAFAKAVEDILRQEKQKIPPAARIAIRNILRGCVSHPDIRFILYAVRPCTCGLFL